MSSNDALADRFRVERELGRGGMATVFLTHDLKQERLVALKVIHPHVAAGLGPERFLREIKLTAKLRHPHILPLFDSGEIAGQLWYTMPYVEGGSLRQRLTRDGRLPWEQALDIGEDVLAALSYAHQQGIIHRDIKPENILLEGGFALPNPEIRIDYPTWSPDGHWVLFDRAAPKGGDLWLSEASR
jgi:eukaryotic-like serine/threonine-protein kinase